MKVTLATAWSNYKLALREKVIVTKNPFEKEYFFQIHKEYLQPAPFPSHVISKMIMDYRKLHNHSKYFETKLSSKCPICTRIKTKKR